MKTIFVMAGTTEGRQIVERMLSLPIEIVASVATPYGASLLPQAKTLKIVTGKCDCYALKQLLQSENIDFAIDATHPYAVEASRNLHAACEILRIPYERLRRDSCEVGEGCITVACLQEAADYLREKAGNVLLTIGSNGLDVFAQQDHEHRQYFARVLPLPKVLEKCAALGFDGRHVIAMQGPFSTQYNLALLREIDAKWMVTKESGDIGGFFEKLEAAKEAAVQIIVIGRPPQERGSTLTEIVVKFQKALSKEGE